MNWIWCHTLLMGRLVLSLVLWDFFSIYLTRWGGISGLNSCSASFWPNLIMTEAGLTVNMMLLNVFDGFHEEQFLCVTVPSQFYFSFTCGILLLIIRSLHFIWCLLQWIDTFSPLQILWHRYLNTFSSISQFQYSKKDKVLLLKCHNQSTVVMLLVLLHIHKQYTLPLIKEAIILFYDVRVVCRFPTLTTDWNHNVSCN